MALNDSMFHTTFHSCSVKEQLIIVSVFQQNALRSICLIGSALREIAPLPLRVMENAGVWYDKGCHPQSAQLQLEMKRYKLLQKMM